MSRRAPPPSPPQPAAYAFADIPAFCIVTPGIEARAKQFAASKKIVPQLQAFTAVMGGQLNKSDLRTYMAQGTLDKLTVSFSLTGEIGCFLSHLAVLQGFVESGREYCLVIEDDLALVKDFEPRLMEALHECPEDWDLLYVYAKEGQRPPVMEGKKHLCEVKALWTTLGYLVSRRGARKITQMVRPMRAMPIDKHFVLAGCRGKLAMFATRESLGENLGDLDRTHRGLIPSMVQKSPPVAYFFVWQFFFRLAYWPYFFLLCLPLRFVFRRHFLVLPAIQPGQRRFPRLWGLAPYRPSAFIEHVKRLFFPRR